LNERVAEGDSSNPHDFNVGKPNILVLLNLAITYQKEVIVIAMHEVIASVRIDNFVRSFELNCS
jgi:hypothetical protein